MKNLSEINHNLDMVTKKYVDDAAAAKVDKVEGKQLSTNDYTNEEKEKLNSLENYILPVASDDAIGGIKSGTDITVDGDGNVSINDNSHKHTTENISDLDSYIENKITIPTYDEIKDKPTLNGMVIEGVKISADYGLANAVHNHTIEDIAELNVTVDELNYVDGVTSNIQTQLNNKADTVHTHTVEQITNLSKSSIGLENVENKSSETIRSEITSDNVAAALGYTPAESMHTHVAGDITNLSKTSVGLGNVDNKSSEKIRSEITSDNVTDALGFTPMNANLKGAVSGVAELDANGKVPASQLPSYIDDVLEYTSKTDFPTTGEDGKIYVDLTSNLTYRWGGSAYVEISPSLALGETSSTAYRGDKGKVAYDHSQIADGSNPHETTFANIISKPTTLSGYGITDAKIANGIITLGTNNIAPLTSESTLDATKLVGTTSISTTGNAATATTAASLQGVTATATELNYVDGVTSNIQTQLDNKASAEHDHDASNITVGTLNSERLPVASTSAIGGVKIGNNLVVDENGALNVDTIDYNELSNQPTLNGVPLTGDLSASDLGINDTNVYYGTEEPTTENVTMWIDPSGEGSIEDTSEKINIALASIDTVAKYNKPVVVESIEDVMLPTTGNLFPTTWEDISTSQQDIFRANGITISAPKHDTTNSGGAEASLEKAFDNYVGSSSGQGYKYHTTTNTFEMLIAFDEPTKITKTQISFGTGSTAAGKISNIYFKGSKNGTEWFTLASYTGSSTNTFTYQTRTLVYPDYYSLYKLEYISSATEDDDVRIQLEEFQTVEYYSAQPTTVYTYTLDLPIDNYEENQIINIEGTAYNSITTFEKPYLNINNLGRSIINGTITAGDKYHLIYDGNNWNFTQPYKVIKGTYTGVNNSSTGSIITLGFKPKAVIVYSHARKFGMVAFNDGTCFGSNDVTYSSSTNQNWAQRYVTSRGNITITDTGFVGTGSDYNINAHGFDNSGITYNYIAFK